MSEDGEIYTTGKNVTLPPAVTALKKTKDFFRGGIGSELFSEVEFVHPVSAGGSVQFVASGVNFSMFTHFLCFFLQKLLKLGEIDGVKFLA